MPPIHTLASILLLVVLLIPVAAIIPGPMSTFEDVTDTKPPGGGAASVGESVGADTDAGAMTRELMEETVPFLRDPRPEIR